MRQQRADDQISTKRVGARPVPSGTFRPEIQGLRALAVMLVVIYHVWFNRVSGGVDVFLVISGFLLTGQLARAAARGPIDLRRRWSRTVVRLVPSTSIVLLGTTVAAIAILPEGRWPQTVREVVASALFLENWQLAADATDYSARNNIASVVQHFWSLSIQGQVFFAWPVLVAGVLLLSRFRPGHLHPHLSAAVGLIFAGSLSYSIWLTAMNQPLAYFNSFTRLWEFALGGLLALWIDAISLPSRLRPILSWIGVVGLICCGVVLDGNSVFPGYEALWPAGCAALVLVAGVTGTWWGVNRLLAHPVAQYVGNLSFTLYLWHWPILVLYLVASDRETVGFMTGVILIAFAVGLSVLTHHFIEQPLLGRRMSMGHGYRLGMVCLVGLLLVTAGWQTELSRRADVSRLAGDPTHPGAVALSSGPVDPAPLLPPPVTIYDDWVPIQTWDCVTLARFAANRCTQPVAFTPTQQIVVVGDSHIQQIAGALVPLAQVHQWQLTFILRGACPFSTASEVVPDDPECLAWNDAVDDELLDLQPDVVVTLASRDVRAGLTEQTPVGFVEQWQRLSDAGIPVLAVRDNPRFDSSMPDCVEQHNSDETICGVARDAVYAPDPPWTQVPDIPASVAFLDVADDLCDALFCPAVIGNVFVYMDDNHLTATYTETMAGPLEDAILDALGQVRAPTIT